MVQGETREMLRGFVIENPMQKTTAGNTDEESRYPLNVLDP